MREKSKHILHDWFCKEPFGVLHCEHRNFSGSSDSKASAYNAGNLGSIPGSGRSFGEGSGNPLQCSCLEKSRGRRNLVGYSPWGRKESDMTEWPLLLWTQEPPRVFLYLQYWFQPSYRCVYYSSLWWYCTFLELSHPVISTPQPPSSLSLSLSLYIYIYIFKASVYSTYRWASKNYQWEITGLILPSFGAHSLALLSNLTKGTFMNAYSISYPTGHRVAKNRTWLTRLSMYTCTLAQGWCRSTNFLFPE